MLIAPPKRNHWQGRAAILENHDGDTLKAILDLGFGIAITTKLRVAGVQAPELGTPGGQEATAFLAALCPPGIELTTDSRRLDKYGRAEAVLTLPDGRDVATEIMRAGHGIPADDRTKAPI
jgi:endonuclease YncB( thermonuclease family)